MKSSCERCGQPFERSADARSCSYDCTFCVACATAMSDVCPNCAGALVARAQGAA